MKILVTGGCGYIGSHTIIELVRKGGIEPISIDNYINSEPVTMDHVEAATGKRVKNYAIDLCDLDALRKVFSENPDIQGVIHFAALKSVPESVEKPLLYYQNNINSWANVLACCHEFGVKNVIFSSSCSVYGNVTQLPVSEETPLLRTESPYAYTKQVGERMAEDFVKQSEVRVIALRYFNPVGADHSGHNGESPINPPTALVPVVTQTAIGIRKKLSVYGDDYNTRDGSCIRDYIHVSDIADAHVMALEYLNAQQNEGSFEVFNLGSGNGVTVFEALRAFENATGIQLSYDVAPRRPGDVEAIYSNSEKAATRLGWQPKRGVDEMMRSAWVWQQRLSNKH